jgi:hypothetical protein
MRPDNLEYACFMLGMYFLVKGFCWYKANIGPKIMALPVQAYFVFENVTRNMNCLLGPKHKIFFLSPIRRLIRAAKCAEKREYNDFSELEKS